MALWDKQREIKERKWQIIATQDEKNVFGKGNVFDEGNVFDKSLYDNIWNKNGS